MLVRRAQVYRVTVGIALLAGTLAGCQSAQRESATQPARAPGDTEARIEDSIARSDAERAKEALERDWPKGERRPTVPPRRPLVDQPRPPRR